jgi:hypothetical protein
MTNHPAAKVLALLGYLKSIMGYARYKKPETMEEAHRMLELIAGVAEEGIEEEKAAA